MTKYFNVTNILKYYLNQCEHKFANRNVFKVIEAVKWFTSLKTKYKPRFHVLP
jgi:hypothetical protein